MASDGNMLSSPALTGKNGEYIFNQTGVDAIKSELVNGRAVSIAFYGDQSAPGQELSADDDNFISFFDKDGNPRPTSSQNTGRITPMTKSMIPQMKTP